MRAAALLVAAGRGERFGGAIPKGFTELAGRPLLAHAVEAAVSCPGIERVVVAVSEKMVERARASLEHPLVEVVVGGETRQASVLAALEAVGPGPDLIVCHDAARPLAPPALFATVLRALVDSGADGAIPIVAIPDTVKRIEGASVAGTLDREALGLAQTPQAFRRSALEHAHRMAAEEGFEGTDDSALLERAGFAVVAIAGDPRNLKVTTRADLALAEVALEDRFELG